MIFLNCIEGYDLKGLQLFNTFQSVIHETIRFMDQNPDHYSVSIRITNNKEIQELNHLYRGMNVPTDILSFTADEFDPESELTHLGDLVISYDKVEQQALEAGHTLSVEFALLAAHGSLHLYGFDHTTKDEKKEMWQTQSQILANISIFPKKLPD